MRIVFMGSPGLACPSLEALLATGEVAGVMTQPDRPKGRQLQLAACPVKELAAARGVPVLQPERVNAPEALDAIRSLRPDLIVVVAFGQILKPPLLALPPLGCINVHASLLPRYRGAAPIQWAIANGETVTGVTTMFMSPRLDAGDVILQATVPIDPADTGATLHDRLGAAGAALLVRTLDLARTGRPPRTPQDESAATYAPLLTKADGRIDWSLSAVAIHNRVRAFHPWPGAVTTWAGRRLKVLKTRVEPARAGVPPGTVAAVDEGPLIAAGAGAVRLLEVQPEGGRAMPGTAFLAGHRLASGDALK